ncbi:Myrosinase 1 [Blattella germanica]|nr:Myrosinase 1 [Blattella germanica]
MVKYWITFNEPFVFTIGYECPHALAPAIDAAGFGKYLASHTILKAHARAFHLYHDEYKATQEGQWIN